ncbi:calcium-binding protein [Fibrobacter sp.]|uniref:calcium-binding protein n=1 Tax=Fibrobacter sp. TaxID=35828 RepID=UPI0026119545|nr:calcium-binding protein [Fibrobacter sp.]MDD5942645.1 calcium-binding protein [Fibrobacter sp.]
MSNSKKNKMFKKNNRFDCKIEQLEPRLMMDATADEWNQEALQLDVNAASIFVSCSDYQKWANTNIRTLFVKDSNNDDVRIAKAKDLIDDNQAISLLSLNSSEVANLKQIMGSASQIAKSSYRQSLLNTPPYNGINDPNTSAEEKQSLINSLDSAVNQYKFSAAEMAVYLNALASTSGFVFGVDAESDSLVVSIVKHETATNPDIAANVTGFANVATNLQGVNVDGGHNVDRNASFSVKLDGASNPEYINQTVSVAAHFRQYTQQDVDDESDSERKAELEDFLQANGSVLEYKSIADVDESVPDYSVGLGLSAAGVNEIFRADLDFDVVDSSRISGLVSSTGVKLVCDENTHVWSWVGAADVESIEHATMGLILQKLSDLSAWLNRNSTVTPDNPVPLLYDSFAGVLSQNATEYAKLPSLLNNLLNKPPKSLQELHEIMKNDVATPVELNGDELLLSFKLSVPEENSQNVSIAVDELSRLGFTVTRNESLALRTSAILEFTLSIDLTAQMRADGTTFLKDVVAEENILDFYGRQSVSVDNNFDLKFVGTPAYSDARSGICLYKNVTIEAGYVGGFSLAMPASFNKEFELKWNDLNDAIKFYATDVEELVSAIQATFTESGVNIHAYNAGSEIFLVKGDKCNVASVKLDSTDFTSCYVKVVENTPIDVKGGDIVLTFDGNVETITIGASDNLDRGTVISQINEKLAGIDDGIFSASFKDGLFAIECKDNMSFDVSGTFFSNNNLFISGVTSKISSAFCLKITIENTSTPAEEYFVDLASWYNGLPKTEQASLCLNAIITKICEICENKIVFDGTRLVGADGYNLVSVEVVGGTLGSILGLAGKADDGARFELDALLLSALDAVKYKKFDLVLENKLIGDVDIDARVGMLGEHFSANGVNMGHQLELKYDDTKGLTQLPDTDVIAIHQAIATLATDFENAYNILTACLDKVFNGTALTTTNISSYAELLSSIDGFVNTIKSLGNRIENVWNYVNQEYGSIVSEFEDQKVGLLEDIEDIISYIPDCSQDFLTLFKDCDFAKIVSVIQELNNARNDINGIFPTTAADYVQSIKTLFSGISSSIETYLGVSNWSVTKTPLLGTTNSITIISDGTDNFNLGSFGIVNNVAAVNDTVQGLISGTSIATALNWDTTGLSEDALKVWSGVELGGAMKAAAADFAQKLLGYNAEGHPVAGNSLFEKSDILTSEIPFIGKSIADLCGFNAKLEEFRRILASVNGLTMQDFAAQLLDRIGMSVSNLKVLQVAEGVEQKHSIQMDFVWKYEVKNGKFVLNDIGSNGAHIGGALDVNLNVSFAFQISMVLEYDPTADGKVKVKFIPVEINGTAQKLVEASASIEKNPLAGDLHLYFGEFQAPLVEIVDGSNISLKFECDINLEETASVLGLSVDKAIVSAGGKINISVLGQKAGCIEIGCGENGTGSVDLKTDAVSKLVPSVGILSNPVNKTGLWVDATQVNVDFNVTSLFEQVRLVSDGLSQVLRRAISGVNKEVLRDSVRNIPFIGDRIVGVADSLTKLDESFIEPFRNFVNKAQNLNAEMVAFKLYNLLKGANILGELEDCSGSTDAQSEQYTWANKIFNKFYNNIQYYESAEEAYWHVRICGNYDLDPNADFDLGFPGLGLRSEGGLKISLTWSLDIGFGISENDGAFLLLADGNDFEVKLNVNTKDGFKVDGSLGFMKMSLRDNTSVDNSKAFGDRNGFVVNLDVDLNNQKDKLVNVHNVGSGISVKAEIDAELKKTWELALSAGSMFPELDVDLYIDWSAKTGAASNGLNELSFKNVKFKGGTFIDKTVAPVLENIRKVIEPIQPLIKFLQSEIPVLNKLPAGKVHITVLDLIKMYGSKNDMDFGFIDDIVQLNNMVQIFGNVTHEGLVVELPDFVLWENAANYDGDDFAKRDNANRASLDFLSGASKNIDAYVQQLRETFTLGEKTIEIEGLKEFADALKDFKIPEFDAGSGAMESTSLSMNGGRGWAFPILENPLTEIGGLLFGRDATLVTYNMSPLKFNFDWKNSYPIVGPLCADIGFNFGVCIDLTFGYDTHGLSRWKDSDYKNIGLLLDGFYIADWNENGKDTAEVIFHSGVVAGASVAGRAGINVGLNFDVNLDFNDPNNDGKLRMGELANMWQTNPIYIFDASATIDAEAYAYLDYFFGRKKWTLWSSGAFELFDTASKSGKSDNPVLVSDNGDYLVVNVGENASNRVHGNLADERDFVTIEFNGAKTGTVKWKNSENGTEKCCDFDVGEKKGICISTGLRNDVVTIRSNDNVNVAADIIVYGGDDNDVINASELSLAGGYNVILMGDLGIDKIIGAGGSGNNFIFGETGRYVMDKNKKNVLLAETLPADGDVSGNVLTGGSGSNFIFGGEGGDVVYAGTGLNYLFGDRGRIEISAADLPVASRYDLFDEGEDDLIYGSDGDDHIYGGAGNDWIEGFAGNDEIIAGQGNDIVFGGNGIDTIHGGDGDDLIFGDTPFKSNMVIASKNNSEGVLPYVYVSKEYKKDTHPLFNSNNREIALKTPEEHYISTLSQYGATLKSSSGMLSNSTDYIYGGNGSDIIFGDDGKDETDLLENEILVGGNDVIESGADNDFIDGDAGDDRITGGSGEDIIYGGQGNDILDGGAGNDIVFGDDGINGFATDQKGTSGLFANQEDSEARKNQGLVFGDSINSFVNNFGIKADAKSNTSGGADMITAGNGSDIVDGQSGDDSYIVNMMGGGNRAYTNVMDSGKNDASDSLTINGTVNADEFLIRASGLGLGMVASLPEIQTDPNSPVSRTQIERVNFWNVGGEKTGVENLAVNAGAGDDKISIDGTLSTIAIDAGAGNDTVTVGQMFDSKRTTDANLSNVQPKDVFGTTETTQGYLSNGVEHATSIVGGEGNDTFNVLHNKAAVSLSGGLGNDTFNVAMFQEKHEDETTSIVENGPVTLIGGAGIDKMSIAGSEGDDTFVISHGRIFGEGIDVQTVSIEDKNVYGGDGDDSFYVLDSEAKEITKLYGNKGNDSFYNGGVGSADMPAFLTATAVDSGAINVVFVKADDTTKVLDTPTAVLHENGNAVDAYRVKLDRAPKAGETVTVTVFAPGATTEAHGRGDREIWLVDGSGKLCKSMTFKFAATATGDGVVAWDSPQLVKVKAIGDAVREGDDYFSLLHNVSLTATQTNVEASVVKTCKNALVFLDEPGTQTTVDNKFSVTREVVVTASTGNEVAVDNLLLPPATSGISAWYMQDGAPVSIDAGRLSIDEEVLKININSLGLTPGTRIYFNYQHSEVLLDDESVVQMAYSTEGMTDKLMFTSADDGTEYSVYAESQLGTLDAVADDARYVYRTAGTQIIILDKVSLKPVSLKGNISFQQVDDSFVFPQVTIYDEENSFQNVSKEEIAQHMLDNTIENIKGALYEDGMGKEFSLGDVGPEMLRYGTSTTPTTNDEKNAASAEDLAAWAAAAQAAAQFDESQSVDRVFTNNMGNAKAGVKNDLQALESVGTIDQSLIPVAGGSPVILNSLPDVQKQADTELFNSDSESLRFTHKDLAATDENRINTGNMEYGEYNLGSGADTVDIYKSIYREDGFQTFTVMNSGEGGDTINVHSYQDGEDDQLVINAGEGNDTVAATGTNVTKEGLIVFGGLGDDSIDIDSDSSLVFGDRGQVLYHDDDGHVVTRLGDDGSGVTVKGEGNTYTPSENGSDYATGKTKESEAYWQTDGVRRGPSIARTVTENQGGNDVITLADGRNVVFGGVNAIRTVLADTSEHENENEVISTGNGNDLVFGDDGYATFGGHASIAEALGQDNAPEVRTEATLSFNFMGASQTGLSSEDVAGAADFAKSNWNNVGGSLAGTYGNDDREIVRFDDNTRASAVSVSYGGIESHRNTSTDNRINLQAYGHNFANASTDADAALMNSGYMTTAPGNQCDNKLEVAVDGLAQYFTDYRVAVYLDMPDANSWEGQSIRKVSLYIGSSATAYASYYVNDCAGSNFNGTYKRSEYTSAEDILADLAHNAAVLSGELTGDDAVLIDTTGNYVVFEVPAGVAADSFRVIIEDGYTLDNINGKDIPGIAAIQVKGTLHAQDVAASTDIAHGGADTVYTSGGDDIVVGGTGGDTLTTYGDERYGIYDNDVVFGDNAKMVFTDRDSSEATASTLSLAESLDSRTVAGDYNDHIYTGDGNDVVVGGQEADHIESGATAAAEAMLDGIQVASFNFTRENATASEIVAPGDYIPVLDENNQPVYENDKQVFDFIPHETAGVVADNDWTNLYIKNNGLHVVGENYTNDPVTHDGIGISLVAYDTAVGDGTQNSSLMPKDDAQLDGDTSNSKLFNAYYAAQQQQEIKLTLTNLDSFADGAPCDVYVYLGGDQQNTDTYNYLFDVWGHQVGGATPDQHYYLNDWTGSHFDGDYRLVECATAPTAAELLSQVAPDMRLIGNYVVFHGVSSATFEVRIRNLFTDTNQWPLNLPVITAVQVVAGTNREEDIAVGGDHDKDLVFGDDARVTFDIDAPFARNENLADYANRAIEAESMHFDGAAVEIPLDENDEPIEMGDTILTGKDRDVIVGGDFGDTITMGDGDDVALGDNASIILEHNNPVGVFAPSVEIMLEQHTVTTSTPEVFLGNNDADADDIQDKFENGGVPGVTPETSANGDTDFYADVSNKDWVLQQEATPGKISRIVDVSSAQVITFAEGETVLLVSDSWPGNQWWHPNIVMVADGQGHSVPALEWEWDVNGTTMTATTQEGYYFTVDIPDTPNGDNRYEIRVTALTAGTAVISIGA